MVMVRQIAQIFVDEIDKRKEIECVFCQWFALLREIVLLFECEERKKNPLWKK